MPLRPPKAPNGWCRQPKQHVSDMCGVPWGTRGALFRLFFLFSSLLRFVSGIPRADGGSLHSVGDTTFSRMENGANRTLLKFSKGKCHVLGQARSLQSRIWDHRKTTSGHHIPFWAPPSKRDLGVLGPARQIHQAGRDTLSVAGSIFSVEGKGKPQLSPSWGKRSSSLPIFTLGQAGADFIYLHTDIYLHIEIMNSSHSLRKAILVALLKPTRN